MARRVGKRPGRGQWVETRYGRAQVTMTGARGQSLLVRTKAHGIQSVDRADNGHWVIYDTEDEPA